MATIDYSKVYDEYNKAKDFELQQQAASLQKQVDEYASQRDKINKNYADAANTAYNNSRLTSRGRAENLAAMGLGGRYYDNPTSGYGENLIKRADSQLTGALNQINVEKTGKLTDVDNYISQVQAAAKANSAGIESSYAQKIAALQKEEADARVQYQLELQKLAVQSQQATDDWKLPIDVAQYNDALKKFKSNNNQGAFATIASAVYQKDPSLYSDNPTKFKQTVSNIVSRLDGSNNNLYDFNNWWYKTTLGDQHNGWGMNW